jgi:hypothetical protein
MVTNHWRVAAGFSLVKTELPATTIFCSPLIARASNFTLGITSSRSTPFWLATSRHEDLTSICLSVSDLLATQLKDPRAGLYFDWGPDSLRYHPHIDLKPEPPMPAALLDAIKAMRSPTVDPEESAVAPKPSKVKHSVENHWFR